MKYIMMAFLFFTSLNGEASIVQSKIASLDLAQREGQAHLILLVRDGQVGFLDSSHAELLEKIKTYFNDHDTVEFQLDSSHRIQSAKSLGRVKEPQEKHPNSEMKTEYAPTILSNEDSVQAVFSELNPNARQDSECYNRAHVWAYEEKIKRDLNAMKVFLFFTHQYIRDYNYGWWFHVSPFYVARSSTGTQDWVTDPVFTEGPLLTKDWTDIFIQPHTLCPQAKKYSDYSEHQEGVNCYVMKVSMYFWQPQDIEENENSGALKTYFIPEEIEWAYTQGF